MDASDTLRRELGSRSERVVVLDANVLVHHVTEGALAPAARTLVATALDLGARFEIPDFASLETANALARMRLRRDTGATPRFVYTDAEITQRLKDLNELPLTVVPAGDLVDRAVRLARRWRKTVYDGMYLALAETRRALFVTADGPVVRDVGHTERWIVPLDPALRRAR